MGEAPAPLLYDLAKLMIQFAGAALIAWFTVKLALSRFKSEKMWERQTSALADVLIALAEMNRINDRWYDAEVEERTFPEGAEEKLRARYQSAADRFHDVSAVAQLVLPPEIASKIEELEKRLSIENHESWFDQLDHDGAIIKAARLELIETGKKVLRR